MAIPLEGSNAYRLCQFIYRNGGVVSLEGFRLFGQSINAAGSTIAPNRITSKGYATVDGDKLVLAGHVMNYFIGCERQERAPKGDIVPPRQINLLQRPELTGYTASLTRNLREPIRDMSFHRTFASALTR